MAGNDSDSIDNSSGGLAAAAATGGGDVSGHLGGNPRKDGDGDGTTLVMMITVVTAVGDGVVMLSIILTLV
ncbi:unnamed protein product [Echinostoma caproni]|uniref:Uncharacterized protein n=1 Tax=Echinostoma caproni TaxID=27848 RepID=A0A183A757_9TREM|nr:unnamed protein product [Echinostoma caproni]